MTIKVSFDISKEFDVNCMPDKVFDILANIPKSAKHFPKVDKLIDLEDNSFQWNMKKLGTEKYSIQTIYACKYENSSKEGWVKWIPVKDVGNAAIEGGWDFKENDKKGTHIDFFTKGVITVPFSSLLKVVIAPIVKHEFDGLIKKYIENLSKTFNS